LISRSKIEISLVEKSYTILIRRETGGNRRELPLDSLFPPVSLEGVGGNSFTLDSLGGRWENFPSEGSLPLPSEGMVGIPSKFSPPSEGKTSLRGNSSLLRISWRDMWREPGGSLEGIWRESGGKLEGNWRESLFPRRDAHSLRGVHGAIEQKEGIPRGNPSEGRRENRRDPSEGSLFPRRDPSSLGGKFNTGRYRLL